MVWSKDAHLFIHVFMIIMMTILASGTEWKW